MKRRINWIDTTKGLGIILMVAGHTSIPSLISNWIWSFHMPLFFIISGTLCDPNKIKSWRTYIRHKSIVFIIPYIFFLICDLLFRLTWGQDISIQLLTKGNITFAYWFLQVLYPCVLINALLIKYVNKYWYTVLIIFLSVIGYILSINIIHFPYRLEVLGLASLHYGFGYLAKDYFRKIKFSLPVIITCLFGTMLISYFIPRLDMNYNQFGSYFPNILAAWFGTITMILISKKIVSISRLSKLDKILSWAGKNSMLIMGLSIPINMSIKYALEDFTIPHSVSFGIQHILLWTLLLIISIIVNKYTPILVGKANV